MSDHIDLSLPSSFVYSDVAAADQPSAGLPLVGCSCCSSADPVVAAYQAGSSVHPSFLLEKTKPDVAHDVLSATIITLATVGVVYFLCNLKN